MLILAIDTTGIVASVALLDEHKTVAEFTINNKKTHSQTLMPLISQMLALVEIDLESMDYIACSSGPGSFTGLRIGAATAKALAHSINRPIIPVPTLDAIAYNVFDSEKIIIPIMDARRNQVYTAFYQWEMDTVKAITEYMAEDLEKILIMAKSLSLEKSKKVVFLGDGISVYSNEIVNFDCSFSIAPSNMNMQRAASVGSLAFKTLGYDNFMDYSEFKPFYLRKSQAEREKENRND